MISSNKIISYFCFFIIIVWLSSFNMLRPLPYESIEQVKVSHNDNAEVIKNSLDKKAKKEGIDIETALDNYTQETIDAIWLNWLMDLFFIFIGILLAILFYLKLGRWKWPVFIISILFIVSFIFNFSHNMRLNLSEIINTYKTAYNGYMLSGNLDNKLSFMHINIILPISHIFIILFIPFINGGYRVESSEMTRPTSRR